MDSQLCTDCAACLLERVFVLCKKAGKITQVPHLASLTRKHAVQPPSSIGLKVILAAARVHSLDRRFELPKLWLARSSNGQ